MDKVIDPLGGSYSIESLCSDMENKAWSKFQEYEKLGGWSNRDVQLKFQTGLQSIRAKRIDGVKKGDRTLIGVNTFNNPDTNELKWFGLPTYYGMPALNLEIASS